VRLALRDTLAVRHAKLRDRLRTEGLDALVVTHLPNLFYLTNFAGSAGIAVVTVDRLYLIVDFRYGAAVDQLQASPHACPDAEIVPVDRSYDESLVDLLVRLAPARTGIEGSNLTVTRCHRIAKSLHASILAGDATLKGTGAITLVSIDDVVERLRLVKDDHEIEMLRRGGLLLSAVALDVIGDTQTGMTEQDLAAKIDWRIKTAGFERCSFETIVASGPNAAQPHAHAGDRVLKAGDLVVLDFGGVYGGYCVDLTRTVAFSDPGPGPRAWHAAVLAAQAAAVAAVEPGRPVQDVDRAARDLLAAAGLGDAFSHGTGHGLGLEVHEAPRVGPHRAGAAGEPMSGTVRLPEHLQSGMVFTVEPGVYLSGQGGVRIEDDVLVTASGAEVLTSVPTTLDLS
jgi:Xaa-Pro aminopeptidase